MAIIFAKTSGIYAQLSYCSLFVLIDLLFYDLLCQGMFSLNSIGCVTKCGPAGILEGNTTDRCMRLTCSNLHTERFKVIF